MKWLNGYRMRLPSGSELRAELVFVGFVAAIVIHCGSAKADFVFGTPENLGPVINSASSDYSACVSADGLELYFCSERTGGFGAGDIWISTRQSVNDPWGPPTNFGSTVNSPYKPVLGRPDVVLQRRLFRLTQARWAWRRGHLDDYSAESQCLLERACEHGGSNQQL
jgi:hypothetical protein